MPRARATLRVACCALLLFSSLRAADALAADVSIGRLVQISTKKGELVLGAVAAPDANAKAAWLVRDGDGREHSVARRAIKRVWPDDGGGGGGAGAVAAHVAAARAAVADADAADADLEVAREMLREEAAGRGGGASFALDELSELLFDASSSRERWAALAPVSYTHLTLPTILLV